MEARYYSLDTYLKNTFGEKVYRLSLNAGMTCPNRDGKLDTRGCIFCSAGGSGDFAASPALSITEQIEEAKLRVLNKTKCSKYVAYFQAYTNTYAPVSYLRRVFFEAIKHPDIVALSIATRCDCLSEEVLDLLEELRTNQGCIRMNSSYMTRARCRCYSMMLASPEGHTHSPSMTVTP